MACSTKKKITYCESDKHSQQITIFAALGFILHYQTDKLSNMRRALRVWKLQSLSVKDWHEKCW